MNRKIIENEIIINSTRSSGPGGQHANKTDSKVVLTYYFLQSSGLTDQEKKTILSNVNKGVKETGVISFSCQESRSQIKNRSIVIDRFFQFLEAKTKRQKKRIPTKATRSSKKRTLEKKKQRSEIKKSRQKIDRSKF